MPTLFESALGYPLPCPKLRRAVCRHRSVLPGPVALRRYDYSQEVLAYLGDRLLHTILKQFAAESPGDIYAGIYEENCLHSNQFMYYYVADTGLSPYLHIRLDPGTPRKTLYHEHGTYFEAIFAAVYLSHGYGSACELARHYVQEVSTLVYLGIGVSIKDELSTARRRLYHPETHYHRLSEILTAHKFKLGLSPLRRNASGHVGVTLNFHLPGPSHSHIQGHSVRAYALTFEQAIESACRQALDVIDPACVRQAS